MKISELKAQTGDNEVEGVIIDVQPARIFNKFGKEGRVANAKLQDDSGTITLSLWNEQVDQVKMGDRIKISKGWVGDWQGNLQLSTGKFGTLEVIYPKGSESSNKELSSKPAPSPAKAKAQPAHEAGKYKEPVSAPKALGPDDVADENEFTEEFIEDK